MLNQAKLCLGLKVFKIDTESYFDIRNITHFKVHISTSIFVNLRHTVVPAQLQYVAIYLQYTVQYMYVLYTFLQRNTPIKSYFYDKKVLQHNTVYL